MKNRFPACTPRAGLAPHLNSVVLMIVPSSVDTPVALIPLGTTACTQ